MRPREKTGGATWTSEKFKNVQRLIERSRQLSGGCAFRECERMSDGKISGATVFTTESRIGQSSSRHKHVDEGKADLNLTLKLLQQRVNALEQDSSRFNVAFIHLQGGLSKQATASNILLQDFVYTREVVDKLSACFGAANIIDLNKWQTKIENEIASLNRRVHKHEKKGVKEEGRAEEEGQFCNGLRMQTEGADGDEPELPTCFHHDSQHIAGDSWREMEGRLSQKMSSAIERTVSDQPVRKYQIGLTEEGMKDIITNTVLNELGTMVRNELNAIEERIMTQTSHNMNSLVHEAVSNGKLSVSVVKYVSVEKDVQNGFYPTSSAEDDVLLVQNNKEDHLENEVSSREAFSPLRPQQKEADTLYLNRKHAATNCTDSTGCFTEDAPDLNQKLSELTKRVDALTNELRARCRSGEYCEYQERERKQAVGEDDTTVEMVKKNVTLCNEYNQPNAETDIQGIISTQNTLLQRLEQMESMFSSMSQKYSVPVVESLVVTVRELSKRLTDLTKRIDAITVVNDDKQRDDLPLLCRGGDASDIEVCQAEKQHKGSLEDIISAQDDLLLRLEQMESIIILNGKTDGSSALDSDSAVSQLRCRLMEITKQVSALRSKLKEEELNPKNEKEENPHLLNHSVDHVGMVFRPRAVEQEILFEQKSHHDEEEEEVAAELLIPPKSKEDGAVASIRPDNEVEEVTGHDITNIPSLATEKENGGVCQAGIKEVINNGEEQLKFSSHENDIVRDAETAAPQPMQVLGLSTKSNKEQSRAVDSGMVASHREPSQAAAAINDINEVEKSPEKLMVSELPELSALDRLRAWRADIATLRKEGKQHILDSDDDLEESLCLSLNG